MKSFEDYYWSQFDVLNKDTQLARQFGQDVWDYKQKEIDELQTMYEKQGLYAFELQKRIDNALDVFEEHDLNHIDQIEKVYGILKGN